MNNELISKICKLAIISSIVGVCILGICPALGVMGIVVGIVLKYKGVELDKQNSSRIKKAYIFGAISLVLFVVDIVVANTFFVK